jgi:hypothetical protein
MKSHFADEERLREQRDEYIFMKSHFADEEKLRRRGKRLRTNTSLGSLTSQGEISENGERIRGISFADEERLRKSVLRERRETSGSGFVFL